MNNNQLLEQAAKTYSELGPYELRWTNDISFKAGAKWQSENSKSLLKMMQHIANRSEGQLKFLFELCDQDFDKYMLLEATLAKHGKHFVPGDKETLDTYLKTHKL